MADEIKKEINILLIGQTGVGKSTLINAFANYQRYETFKEAVEGEEICLIPTKFSLIDADFNQTVVNAGETDDPNENLEEGQSGTLSCKSYVFALDEGLSVRWIDTSGFGDTRGAEKDRENFQDILQYASQYKSIHAIAVVSKADTVRNNQKLEAEYRRIFKQFGNTSIKNVILIFTHGHKPQGAVGVMKSTFEGLVGFFKWNNQPKFDKSNIFCFENKPFRDILEIKRGLQKTYENASEIEVVWDKSKSEFLKLVEEVKKINPFDISGLLNQQEKRDFICNMSAISGTVLLNLQQNQKILEGPENAEKKAPKINRMKVKECKKGITVCLSNKCVNKFPSAEKNKDFPATEKNKKFPAAEKNKKFPATEKNKDFPATENVPEKPFKAIICCSGLSLLNQKAKNGKNHCSTKACSCDRETHEFLFFSLSSNQFKINEDAVDDLLTAVKEEEHIIKNAVQFIIKFIENDENSDYSTIGKHRSIYKSLLKSSIGHLNAKNIEHNEETKSLANIENVLNKLEIYGHVFRDVGRFSKQGKEVVNKSREVKINIKTIRLG